MVFVCLQKRLVSLENVCFSGEAQIDVSSKHESDDVVEQVLS